MIQTHALQARYGSTTLAFADVDWPQGTLALLQGASGSGKSTWLSLVCALKSPASGSLNVAGISVDQLKASQADRFRAEHVALLPQQLQLMDALNVAENLALAQWAAGLRRDDAAIAARLAELGLTELHQRLPHQLSGGQAQRVALARALLLKPQVILADEPTASLDDQNAEAAIAALTSAAKTSGATLVIATHDRRVPQWLTAAGKSWQSLMLS
jgi:putative ABC transport system ATP-binding protein